MRCSTILALLLVCLATPGCPPGPSAEPGRPGAALNPVSAQRARTESRLSTPPACDFNRMGMHEGRPCLSHDGRTLAWFHREAEQAYLCVLTAPWRGPPQKVKVPNAERVRNLTDPVCLSGDGRQAFVNRQHVEIIDGRPTARGQLPESLGYFAVAASFDGSRLVASAGPDSRMRLLSREQGRYVEEAALTPDKSPHPARRPFLSADGRTMVCELGDRPYDALFDGTAWQQGPVVYDRPICMVPLALSADGLTLLLEGRTKGDGIAENIYLASRNAGGTWPEPQLLLDRKHHGLFSCHMSPNARTVLWVHYARDDHNSVIGSELKFIRRQGDGWSDPATVLAQPGFVQFSDLSLADDDALAYAVTTQTLSSYAVFLRPDLKPGTPAMLIQEPMHKNP